ncbi:MAG TPA: tetratricopeptide repeat protein [Phnomibacter sp.]|nr:tetratricopeptide repeat protein [Phnomibacter sp.]
MLSSMINNIRNYPDSIGLVDKLIDTLSNRGDIDGAAAWCDSLVIRDSVNNFIYTLVKADLFRGAKKYDAAMAAYKAYLAKKPEEPLVFMTLANTMAEAGSAETLDFCNQVWQRFPTPQTRTGLSYIRGVYFNTKKQFAEARRWLDSTIRYDYSFADAYLEKGYSWYDEGNFQEAARTFGKLTEVSPKNADGWYWLGKSYDTLHLAEKAIAAYQRALMYDGSIAEAAAAIERLSPSK